MDKTEHATSMLLTLMRIAECYKVQGRDARARDAYKKAFDYYLNSGLDLDTWEQVELEYQHANLQA